MGGLLNKIRNRFGLAPIPSFGEDGKHIEVMHNTYISADSCIGDYTYIGFNCFVTKAVVGRYCSIANDVAIGQGEHNIARVSTSSLFYSDSYTELVKGDCIIGDDVWIAHGSIVRRGVNIGIGAVIGANSFVNKDVPPFAVVAGNPARIIRYRFEKEIQERILASRWWLLPLEEARGVVAEIEKGL
jgi:acetyltransferase-like isoleucine patch superfamily enzyme